MNDMAAAFEFDSYKITDVSYRFDDNAQEVKQDKIESDISLERNQENDNKYRLGFHIVISGNPHIDMKVYGYFTWNGEYIKDHTEQVIQMFGTQILYPYIRNAVSSISVLDGGKPLILPTINVTELFGLQVKDVYVESPEQENL